MVMRVRYLLSFLQMKIQSFVWTTNEHHAKLIIVPATTHNDYFSK